MGTDRQDCRQAERRFAEHRIEGVKCKGCKSMTSSPLPKRAGEGC